MFHKRNRLKDSLRFELCGIRNILPVIIVAAVIGVVLILLSWLWFGGPCRVTVFFRIPGGGITVAAYYVLWLVMFALAGGEAVLILRSCNKYHGDRTILYHIAAHMCLLLWYPLFFTTFSQFLALVVIAAALVLLILEIKESAESSLLLPLTLICKSVVTAIYVYLNLSFLIIN